MIRYVGYSKVKERFDISSQTIKNWAKRGVINYKSIQNKTRKTWLYDIESIGKHVDSTTEVKQSNKSMAESTVLYCRVSSKKQENDLKRQVELLKFAYPESEVIEDIGSGLNFKRTGFSKLVERICKGEISKIVVTYKDRLMRFGHEMFQQICKEHNCQIVVYSQEQALLDINGNEETQELQEDLLSIINVFVARRNGKRAGQLKKERKRQTECSNKN